MWVENVINMQDNDNLANSYANVQWIKITSIYIAVYKVKGYFYMEINQSHSRHEDDGRGKEEN